MTQEELAEVSGVARSHLARIERGEVEEPRPDTLRRLADALGVEALDLVFGEASVEIFGAPDARGSAHHRHFTVTSPDSVRMSREAAEDRPPETSGRPVR